VRELLEALPEPSRSLAFGEVLALRWSDVDLDKGLVQVRQTVYEGHFDEPKRKGSNRTVPLAPRAVEILRSHKPVRSDPNTLIFGTRLGSPLSGRNLRNRQLKPTAERLGMRDVHWHWLRHASATLLDSVGTPIGTTQKILGHSSPEITRTVYVHSVPADAQEAVEKVEDLLNGPKRTQNREIGFGANSMICLGSLVGERGFEPPTPWSRTRCSTRLSHSPTAKR